MRSHLLASLAIALGSAACAPTLQPPIDQIKAANSNMTAFRLQNFEAPQQPQQSGLQIPPQIQQYVQMAQSMLPPGLLQGLAPGLGAQPAQPQPEAPRFHDFRILGYVPVSDPKNRDVVFELFGHASNFTAPKESCMFAEFGFRLAEAPSPQAQPADVIVSLSCNQVRAFGFNWPYGNNTAFTQEAWKKMHEIVSKSFGGGG